MQLSAEQVDFFRRDGYLSLPVVFTESELDVLSSDAAAIAGKDTPQRVMEKDGEITRSVYWLDGLSDLFARLVRDPRLVEPSRALLGGEVYLYQTQLNPKASFVGDVWKWHQDYLYWNREDGMPNDNVLSAALYLDEVTEFNGPMYVIPGTHRVTLDDETTTRQGADGWENTVNADFRHEVGQDTLARLVSANGLVSTRGARGSVVFFHGNLLHSSGPNLSPFTRTVFFARYAGMDNILRPVPDPRPGWIANRTPEPIDGLDQPLLPI
jgi:ectoine hydroxylase